MFKEEYLYIESIDDRVLKILVEHLRTTDYLKDTALYKQFFSDSEQKTSSIALQYEFDVVKYLVPLIRCNTLVIPAAQHFAEFASLLEKLAGDSPSWNRFAEIIKSSRLHDVYGNCYMLTDSLFVGKRLSFQNSLLFSTKDFDEYQKALEKYNNVSHTYYDAEPSYTRKFAYNKWRNALKINNYLRPCVMIINNNKKLAYEYYDNVPDVVWTDANEMEQYYRQEKARLKWTKLYVFGIGYDHDSVEPRSFDNEEEN